MMQCLAAPVCAATVGVRRGAGRGIEMRGGFEKRRGAALLRRDGEGGKREAGGGAMMDLKIDVTDDRREVSLVFGRRWAALRLDAAGLDQIIEALGKARLALEPPLRPDLEFGVKVYPVIDPPWCSQSDALSGHSQLHLCDPRFGWLHYLLHPEEAKRLSDALREQSERAGDALKPTVRN